MYTLATSGKNGWEGQSAKGWLTEMSRPNGNGRSEDDSGRGRRESWMWSMVPGRGRVSQLSLFTFAHRPNISVTLATPLTWRTSVSLMTTSMWSALEEMTAGRAGSDSPGLAGTLSLRRHVRCPGNQSLPGTQRGVDILMQTRTFQVWSLVSDDPQPKTWWAHVPTRAVLGLARRGGHKCYSEHCCFWGRDPRWLTRQPMAAVHIIRLKWPPSVGLLTPNFQLITSS